MLEVVLFILAFASWVLGVTLRVPLLGIAAFILFFSAAFVGYSGEYPVLGVLGFAFAIISSLTAAFTYLSM